MKNLCAVLAFCAASVAAQYGSSTQVRRFGSGSPYAPGTPTPQQYSSSNYGGGSYSQQKKEVEITRYTHEISGSMTNNVQFETENGISQSENTQVVRGSGSSYDDGYGNQVKSDTTLKKQGNFAYTSPEGQRISTSWSADDKGFSAQGDHLPKPVQMPADHAAAHQEALSRVASSNNNNYGGSSHSSYSSPAPAMGNSYGAPAPAIRNSYNAPATTITIGNSYSAPAPMPAPTMRNSYSSPATTTTMGNSYSAPAPMPAPATRNSYSAPAHVPTPVASNSYKAPAPVPAPAMRNSYSSSGPVPSASVIRVQTYEAPGIMRSTAY